MPASIADLDRYWTSLKASGKCTENRKKKKRNKITAKTDIGTVINLASAL